MTSPPHAEELWIKLSHFNEELGQNRHHNEGNGVGGRVGNNRLLAFGLRGNGAQCRGRGLRPADAPEGFGHFHFQEAACHKVPDEKRQNGDDRTYGEHGQTVVC